MTDELMEVLGHLRFQFWTCPAIGHSESRAGNVETVHWEGDVAHCTWPGCGRTSADKDAEVSP